MHQQVVESTLRPGKVEEAVAWARRDFITTRRRCAPLAVARNVAQVGNASSDPAQSSSPVVCAHAGSLTRHSRGRQNTEIQAAFWLKDPLRVLRCVGNGEHRNTRSVHPKKIGIAFTLLPADSGPNQNTETLAVFCLKCAARVL